MFYSRPSSRLLAVGASLLCTSLFIAGCADTTFPETENIGDGADALSPLSTMSYWTGAYNDAEGWASADSYWNTIRHVDLNGDGKTDVCGRRSAGLYCALSNGSSFNAPTYWSPYYSDAQGWSTAQHYWGTIEFIDLNGDHKADVCARGSIGLYCALSSGSSFGIPGWWSPNYEDAGGWISSDSYWKTIRYADLNGDGKTDVCGRGGSGLYCALSNGSSFVTPSTWTTGYSDAGGWSAATNKWGTIRYPDLDGDGKADVCGRDSAGLLCSSN